MGTYHVLSEYGYEPGENPDLISTDPYWVMCVLRFKFPLMYTRQMKDSFTQDYGRAVELRGRPLIITGDCVGVSVTHGKGSHVSQMQATLLPSTINYLSEIFPGDHVLVWMVNSRKRAAAIIKRIMDGKHCNRFHDGLKFMGRVNTLHKVLSQDPSGARITRYSLNGCGFTELDASIFYDPHLAQKVPALGLTMAKLGVAVNRIMADNMQGISGEKAILTYLDLLLGEGAPPNFGLGDKVPPQLRSTAGLDGPYAYIVPEALGKFFDVTWKSKKGGILSYADMLDVVHGVQNYAEEPLEENQMKAAAAVHEVSEEEIRAGQALNPARTRTPAQGSRRYTGTPMLGTFMPTPPQFLGNRTVWSILSQYLNPVVSEMYTAMRSDGYGLVRPTLVLRQLPFNTDNCDADVPVTRFTDLPRWKIHPALVRSYSIGRSDSQRINFVHVYGEAGGARGPGLSLTQQLARNVPIRDDLDQARSGLRPFMNTVNCHPDDIRLGGPGKWMALASDYLMGQHLTLTGSLELVGVATPIVPGDNLEWEGALFHIESVSHRCSISQDGRKDFSTTLALSHGVSVAPVGWDLGVYVGIGSGDQRAHEPGLTIEGARAAHDHSAPASGPDVRGTQMEGMDLTQDPMMMKFEPLNVGEDAHEVVTQMPAMDLTKE